MLQGGRGTWQRLGQVRRRADLGGDPGCVALGASASLCLGFASCKMGPIIEPSLKGC